MNSWDIRRECESALAAHDALDLCVVVEPRRREDIPADVRLVFADRAWLQSESGHSLVAALRGHPMTAKAQRRKSAIHLRFHDEVLSELERDLAAGKPAGMGSADIAADQQVIVSYVGPNTNKALHVGHLRNVFVGEALASAMAAAGAEVTRMSLVGDIGRRVCEAMAGYRNHHEGEDPEELGVAGDRFVEICCRDFSRERLKSVAAAGETDPNSEERKPFGDLADSLMESWLSGDEAEQELWRRMRGWVMQGHESTLGRLGVFFDGYDYESDGVSHSMDLIAEGVDKGLFVKEEDGAVVYQTGQSEYPVMVLLREDGFPTEHARLLAVYDRLLERLAEGQVHLEVAGLEWQPSITVIAEILERLRPGPRNEADVRVYHGSVTGLAGEKMGSSTGDVVWIDDFLDYIAGGPAVTALEQLGAGRVSREELADLLVRGAFLCAPMTRPLAFVQEALYEGRPGAGWTIAEAWCRAQLARDPREGAEVARTVVMQSQQFRLSLRRTVENRDVTSLARYLFNLSEICMSSPNPGPAAAPMMQRVLGALGFLAGRPDPARGTAAEADAAVPLPG
jgi:arginyl-tRNA synthetase